MASLYIGLMSGTSLDGVDGVLVELGTGSGERFAVLAYAHIAFADALRRDLLDLNHSGENELHRAALAANAVAREYATCVGALLRDRGIGKHSVQTIGAHGQTVRHRPTEFDGTGYTIQLLAPALLAELTGIDVICDFRSRDLAAGGQGAPLVPAFHAALFGTLAPAVAVLNIGGISNLTVLESGAVKLGFDCGPGNALMDEWCQRHVGARFDADGQWAKSAPIDGELLDAMLREAYFARRPPKSTGRDLFNAKWLDALLAEHAGISPARVQASLAELTAMVCARDVRACAPDAKLTLVCGGGALNGHLMERIAAHLPGIAVQPSDRYGLPATQVEACAFAWLAQAFTQRRLAGLPSVTGARGARVLGALYPAR